MRAATPRRASSSGMVLLISARWRVTKARSSSSSRSSATRRLYHGPSTGAVGDSTLRRPAEEASMKSMRVGILGTGDVGKALARGFAAHGHDVKIGSREKKGEFVTFEEAARHGELVILCTRWDGTENALRLAGSANLGGKILIDATNPLKHVDGRPVGMDRGFTDSGGEQVQRWVPQAKVVKAFNIVGNSLMIDPKLPG